MSSELGRAFERHVLLRRGRGAFLSTIAPGGSLIDVGCGNNSPGFTKAHRPDLFYIGLDVGDYNQAVPPSKSADTYILTTPEDFAAEIGKFAGQLDAVLSAHNLEHCNEPDAVVRAMACSLKEGGRLYLSFPCEESVHFPHRYGPLNFYDDPGHRRVPCFRDVCSALQSCGLDIEYTARRYRPLPLFLLGLFLEPVSSVLKKTMPLGSTWALYGFESIIWASRPKISGG